jgi:predicted permease
MLTQILLDILAPILLLISLGALMYRKFKLDLGTLGKLNLYLFVPAFVFDKVATSKLPWTDMAGVVAISVLLVALLGGVVYLLGIAFHINAKTLAAVAMAVMFYNSGNYGIPLAELAFPSHIDGLASARDGGAVQAFVLMTQNVLTFTVGLTIAAWAGSGNWSQGLIRMFRVPVFPTLAAALLARYLTGGDASKLPAVIIKPAEYLAAGLVPLALATLGAQLASRPRWPRWRPVSLVLVLRLLLSPLLVAAILYTAHRLGWQSFDLWRWPAELIILTAGTPTAVNTLLLTLELNGDVDLAADCVFWTTIASCLTVTLWLVVIRWPG